MVSEVTCQGRSFFQKPWLKRHLLHWGSVTLEEQLASVPDTSTAV
jgi:hypothetical protein